tara:strand:- start:46 stop:549 length:504 start_codon:yes stop_codon:yes gene_type:complete
MSENKYCKSIIYKICCLDTNIKEIYIGSTINFRCRKGVHKYDCRNNKQTKLYNFIRDNGGWFNWTMIEIEKYNCNDKRELLKRENEVMNELSASLNCYQAHRTLEEKKLYQNTYNEINYKIHYQKNKEEYSEKSKQKVLCECGKLLSKGSMFRHIKTQKHINKINNK